MDDFIDKLGKLQWPAAALPQPWMVFLCFP